MNPFFTKSIFAWNIPAISGGDPDAIADLMDEAGIETLIVKAANGVYKFIPNPAAFPGWGENLKPELVETLHKRGKAVIGWGFNYGDNPAGEATVAIAQVKYLGLDGWATDGESALERLSNAYVAAAIITKTIKTALPSMPLGVCGWSYYRNPRATQYVWHPEEVLRAQMTYADVGIPMNYWDGKGAASALWCAQNSLPQWRKLTDKPIVPAGRAYTGDGGTADAAGIAAYAAEILKQGCAGLTWWSFEHAVKLPEVWAALCATPKMSKDRELVDLQAWSSAVDSYLVGIGYDGPGIKVV
jgi:hypothetical protein